MSTTKRELSRRDRLRVQTQDDITQAAMGIVDRDGVHAVSLAAIASELGVSAPALYRYHSSRSALIDHLVQVGFSQLAAAVDSAATTNRRRRPAAQIGAIVHAYHQWVLEHPRRYRMLFGERPDDVPDSPAAVAVLDRAMCQLIEAVHTHHRLIGDIDAADTTPLDRHFTQWLNQRDSMDASTATARISLLLWTRVHGIISLELAGAFTSSPVDAIELIDFEIASALAG